MTPPTAGPRDAGGSGEAPRLTLPVVMRSGALAVPGACALDVLARLEQSEDADCNRCD